MTRQRPRIRHWKQRFNPEARMVLNRNITWHGKELKAGDLLPEEVKASLNPTKLKRWWDGGMLQLCMDPVEEDAQGELLENPEDLAPEGEEETETEVDEETEEVDEPEGEVDEETEEVDENSEENPEESEEEPVEDEESPEEDASEEEAETEEAPEEGPGEEDPEEVPDNEADASEEEENPEQ